MSPEFLGATITLVDVSTGSEGVTTTNSERPLSILRGDSRFAQGHRKSWRIQNKAVVGVQAEVSKVARVDIVMEVGDVAETIAPHASVDVALQGRDASIGVVFDEERLRRLATFLSFDYHNLHLAKRRRRG